MSDLVTRLETMLNSGQDNLLLRFGLGKAYAEQHSYDKAIMHLERALELDPNHSSSGFWLGRSHFEAGNMSKAQEVLATARATAQTRGDNQTIKMIDVFLRRINKQQNI
ncbi:tetratricopeptide repeat protein [Paenalcaligenes hominis]|uniref:tetratricopeptide repeat protein n=1 Tax=Paenalcaligenes hominis TaxID=643674 RepID=UPI0035238D27